MAFEAPTQTTIFLGIGAASGEFTTPVAGGAVFIAPSSTELAGGASLGLGAASTANALFGASDFGAFLDAGFTVSDKEGRAGGAAAVFAAPSTADALVGEADTLVLEEPCFGGALFESELITPAGS